MLIKTIEGLEPAEQSKMIAELFTEYNKVKAVMAQPKKNKKAYNYNYSPLDEVLRVIDTAIKESGTNISYTFETITGDGKAGTKVYIFSGKGAWLEFADAMLPVPKNDAQGYGSALTYARRYAISSAFGIASEEDDDAQSISRPTRRTTTQRATAAPSKTAPAKPAEITDAQAKSYQVTFEGIKQPLIAVYSKAVKGDETAKKFCKSLGGESREIMAVITKKKLYEVSA